MAKALIIPEDKIDDFTAKGGSWEIDEEVYTFIETFLIPGDGECHAVIVQRESDKKYFEFSWLYSRSERYHYNERWNEVEPKVITKTKWNRVK